MFTLIFFTLIHNAEAEEMLIDAGSVFEIQAENREYLIRVRNQYGQMVENAWVSLSLLSEYSTDVPVFVEFRHRENGRNYATISNHRLNNKTFELNVYAENLKPI